MDWIRRLVSEDAISNTKIQPVDPSSTGLSWLSTDSANSEVVAAPGFTH